MCTRSDNGTIEVYAMTQKHEIEYEYVYFVSYAHEKGFGNVEVISLYEYTEIEHIREIEEILKKQYGWMFSSVLHFKLLSMREKK